MSETEYHIIRLAVVVKKVLLSVRFPCSIFFQLKHQANTSVGRTNYELKGGLCQPQQKMTIDVDVLVNNSNYSDCKIPLTVFMSSANGKIPAGTIDIKVTANGKLVSETSALELSIDKCPDRNAKIIFSIKPQFIRSHKKIITNQSTNMPRSKYITSSKLQRNINTNSGHNNNYGSTSKKKDYHTSKYKLRNKTQLNDSHNLDDENSISNDSQQKQRSIIYEQFNYDHKRSSRNRDRQKMDRQKAQQHRELQRLKNQIFELKKEQKWGGHQNQLQRYRMQIDTISNQLVQVKQKYRNLQKKQKEQNNTIKALKLQIQKLTNKSASSQTYGLQAKLANQEKEQKLKKLNQQIKQYKEQIQDLKITTNMQEKRIQFKQTTYKQQIKKLTDKYQQSQTERQKATYDLSQMLNQFENSQKKNQLQNKQKERGFMQEKNKLLKKNQQLTTTIEHLQEQSNDLNNRIIQLQLSVKQLANNKQELTQQLNQMKLKLDEEELHNKKVSTKNQHYQKQLGELRQINIQYISLKKKHTEISAELIKTTQNLNRTTKNSNNIQSRLKDLQHNLQGTHKDKDTLQNKTSEQNKEISNLIKNIQMKDQQINQLNDTLSEMSTKISEYRVKLDSEKMRHEETGKKLSAQIVYMMKTNQYQAAQMEQLKWKLQKSQQLVQGMNKKCTSLNQNILKISQELINEQQNLKTQKQIFREQENSLQLLRNQILSKQTRQKQLQNNLKIKTDNQYELKKKTKQKDQQIYLLKQKDRQNEVEYSEKTQQLQNLVNQKNQLISKLIKEHQSTVNSLNQNILVKQQHSKNIQKMQDQNNHYIENINTQKTKVIELQKNINDLTEKLNMSESEKIQQKKVNDLQSHKNKELSQKMEGLKQQWQKYQNETIKAMEQFFSEINKFSQSQIKIGSSQAELIAFPDDNLSNLQIQTFKKRVQLLTKHQQQLKQLNQANRIQAIEIQKMKQLAQMREQELEKELGIEKDKFKDYSANTFEQINQLSERISALQQQLHESHSQKEKIYLQLSTTLQQKQELTHQIQKCHQQAEQLKKEIESNHKNMNQLNKQNQSYRNSSDSQIQTVIAENKSQVDKYKANIKQLQKKVISLEKIQASNQGTIQQLSNRLAEVTHIKQKLQKKVQFSEIKYQQLIDVRKRIQIQLQQVQRKLKSSLQAEQKQRQINLSEKLKNQDLSLKLSKHTSSNEQLKAKLQRKLIQIDNLQKQISNWQETTIKLKQTNKGIYSKSSQQAKQLHEKIIILQSQIQLKTFLSEQQLTAINQLKKQIQEQDKSISSKKTQLMRIQQQNEQLQNQLIFIRQANQDLTQQKQSLQQELVKQRENSGQLNNQVLENQMNLQLIATKDREIQRLREDNFGWEVKLEANNKDLRNLIAELRKQIAAKGVREQQLKRKFRESERELETRLHQQKGQKNRVREESQRQKSEMMKQVDGLDRENRSLRNQLQYIRQNMTKQLQDANQQYSEMSSLIAQKQQALNQKNDEIKDREKKIKILTAELKNCLEGWQKDKTELRKNNNSSRQSNVSGEGDDKSSSRFQKYIDEIVDNRGKNLGGRSKKNQGQSLQLHRK